MLKHSTFRRKDLFRLIFYLHVGTVNRVDWVGIQTTMFYILCMYLLSFSILFSLVFFFYACVCVCVPSLCHTVVCALLHNWNFWFRKRIADFCFVIVAVVVAAAVRFAKPCMHVLDVCAYY